MRIDGPSLQLVTGGHLQVDVDSFDEHIALATRAEADGLPSVALDHNLSAVELYRERLFLDLAEADGRHQPVADVVQDVDPAEPVLAAVDERHPGAEHQIPHRPRRHDPAVGGDGHHAGRDVQRQSGRPVRTDLDLPGVQPDAHLQPEVGEGAGDVLRARDRAGGPVEAGDDALAGEARTGGGSRK